MKEFMTQKELVGEFMAFLKNKGYYNMYRNRMMPKKYIIGIGDNTIEEFAETIYNFDLLTLATFRCSLHDEEISTMASQFIKQFNRKHKEDIKNQYMETIRLLYRYIRDYKLMATFSRVYGSKREFDEHIIKCKQPFFFCSFPGMVLDRTYICDHNNSTLIYEHDKLEQGFRMYYKEMVTEQQQDEWTNAMANEKYTTRFHD